MWSETMDNENGAGWAGGESSFMTDRKPDSKTATIGDRLPVPVTISNLVEHFSAEDDKYVIGNFRFATVLTVGIVKDMQQDGTQYTYDLYDPSNAEMEYRTIKYDSENSNFDHSSIVEGSRVRVIGKLKGFGGSNCIVLFNIMPVNDDKDVAIFELEAHVARLFFGKNMNDKLRNEAFSKDFQGMLAPPKGRVAQTSQESSQGSDTKERLYSNPKQAVKLEGSLQDRICAVLKAVRGQQHDEGSKIEWIAEQVQEPNMENLKEALAVMLNNGIVYNTTEDDRFSAI